MELSKLNLLASGLLQSIGTVVLGKRQAIQESVITLLAGGHLLIEDVPGVGKTTLAKAMAKSIGGTFQRIQFTPDLLPSDITGNLVFNQKEQIFEFRPGPVFSHVLLADEVNRATPKAQSALLEAMEEHTVSVDGEVHKLPEPFIVIATQNNVEMAGTFPLPEAQMDRFMARVTLGYASREDEAAMLEAMPSGNPLTSMTPVVSTVELFEMQAAVRNVHVAQSVREYIVDLVHFTRNHPSLALGASPRAGIHLLRAGQAHAVLHNRDFVSPDDIKAVAGLVLSHRLIPRGEARARGESGIEIVRQILTQVATPVPSR